MAKRRRKRMGKKGGLRFALTKCKGKKGKAWKSCLRSKGIKTR